MIYIPNVLECDLEPLLHMLPQQKRYGRSLITFPEDSQYLRMRFRTLITYPIFEKENMISQQKRDEIPVKSERRQTCS